MKNYFYSAIAVMAFVMFVAVTPVSAATASNDNTGYKSTNIAVAVESQVTTVDVNNNATVNNNVVTIANTGLNKANGNTGDGTVTTGTATATSTVSTNANNGTMVNVPCGCEGNGTVTAQNSNTGAKSFNKSISLSLKKTTVDVRQNARVTNNVITGSNSGGNKASWNTGSGSVKTGGATATSDVTSDVNKDTNVTL